MKASFYVLKLSILIIWALRVQLPAEEASWKLGDPYTAFFEGTWTPGQIQHDMNCGTYQFRLQYLMQAHREAKELAASEDLDDANRRKVSRIVDDLEESLLPCYSESLRCFKKDSKNPTLLLMMIYHYQVYIKPYTANEGWSKIVGILEQVDPDITREALENSEQELASAPQ